MQCAAAAQASQLRKLRSARRLPMFCEPPAPPGLPASPARLLPLVALPTEPHHHTHTHTATPPPPLPQVAILGSDNELLPVGQIGEVCIQGPNVTAGYLNNDAANTEAFAGELGV